ncbi:hypothetical protein BEH94_08325 [Candidatus Altiarchaeales archaeon WOR_SM1_SCG]|nr:hypothetical protein BEH94_08325 [Candidatus Altiarchaeales archaeon WOR_SM1_SCG]
MSEDKNFISRNRAALKIISLFFFFVLFFYLLFYKFIFDEDISREISTLIVVFLLNLLGIPASADGYFINMPNFSLEVIYECIGIWAVVVYSSFVMAYPANLKKKLTGIALGVPGLLVIGIVRMVSLAVIGVSYPDLWEYVHLFLWQLSLIIFVIIFLLLWIEKVVKNE